MHVKDEVHDHLHPYMPMFRKYYVPGPCDLPPEIHGTKVHIHINIQICLIQIDTKTKPRVFFRLPVVSSLPPHDRLVNQGFHLFLGRLTSFVGSKEDSGDLAQLFTHPRQHQAPTFLNFFQLVLQCQEKLFQREWERECVPPATKGVPGHVCYGIQGAVNRAILGFHGHAGQGGDARTCANGFHDCHLYPQQTFGRIARPHLVG